MISSVGSSGANILIAAAIKEVTTAQDVEFAMLKKNQDMEKSDEESVLKLIASASAVTSSSGIDCSRLSVFQGIVYCMSG